MLTRNSRRWVDEPPTPEELQQMSAEDVLSLYVTYSGTDIENWPLTDQQYNNAYATGSRAREEVFQRMERGRR
jgi:hypothetical protein